MKNIDLSSMPEGKRYEDVYGGWLEIFKEAAESEQSIHYWDAPPSWASLLHYLGNKVMSVKQKFPEDELICDSILHIDTAEREGMLRELVECHSTLRPELVDALYLSDRSWQTHGRRHTWKREFKVTCNGSFYRPEVLKYLNEVLPTWSPIKKNLVLVPCAADKPYPAPIHKAVKARLPEYYELVIATGVLGLVPECFWDKMPLYDSGLPNELRLQRVVENIFCTYKFEKVVVYSDFYAKAILTGMRLAKYPLENVKWVFPPKTYTVYEDLLDPKNLKKLEENLK